MARGAVIAFIIVYHGGSHAVPSIGAGFAGLASRSSSVFWHLASARTRSLSDLPSAFSVRVFRR